MSDTILKSKAQLRPISITNTNGNVSPNSGDKTPTTPSKLMINHGKPNFTIQRSPKTQQNGDENPLTHELNANKNNNYNPYKKAESQTYKTNNNNNNNNNIIISTKFNGAFKPANVPIAQKQPHQNGNGDENDNEAAKVVLRRAKVAEAAAQNGNHNGNGNGNDGDDDDAVPEFIKRQRRIQERLAKENILDFENRRSGYFTHMVITPTSPNRQSLVETMTSPAVMPGLEMPPPVPTSPTPTTPMATMHEHEEQPEILKENETNGHEEAHEHAHEQDDDAAQKQSQFEEEEVAKAIEEVNKAVAGEDDDKPSDVKEQINEEESHQLSEEQIEAPQVPAFTAWHPVEPPAEFQNETKSESVAVEEHAAVPAVTAAVATMEINEPAAAAAEPTTTPPPTPVNAYVEAHVEVHVAPQVNGHDHDHEEDVTISHTNGFDGPSIPAPDQSGALGVNYEPKTVVSFSKDLGSEPNNYPDTVKVSSENAGNENSPITEELQDIAKLKFDIKTDEQDVQVTPVLRAD